MFLSDDEIQILIQLLEFSTAPDDLAILDKLEMEQQRRKERPSVDTLKESNNWNTPWSNLNDSSI